MALTQHRKATAKRLFKQLPFKPHPQSTALASSGNIPVDGSKCTGFLSLQDALKADCVGFIVLNQQQGLKRHLNRGRP